MKETFQLDVLKFWFEIFFRIEASNINLNELFYVKQIQQVQLEKNMRKVFFNLVQVKPNTHFYETCNSVLKKLKSVLYPIHIFFHSWMKK